MKKFVVILVFISLFVFTNCTNRSNSTNNENNSINEQKQSDNPCTDKETYIGQWKEINSGGIMTIKDNGSNLFITDQHEQKFTAEIKNDCTLKTTIMMDISYIKSTGHLVSINGEYEKMN